jgi:hypothetical protein
LILAARKGGKVDAAVNVRDVLSASTGELPHGVPQSMPHIRRGGSGKAFLPQAKTFGAQGGQRR